LIAKAQRGSVAIITGLALAVLIGIVGLALDLGRLFVVKTELQNAADACALAASRELNGLADALTRGENAGVTVTGRHRVGFQSNPVPVTVDSIAFSDNLETGYQTSAAGANPVTARYAMCTLGRGSLSPWFMRIFGFGDAVVTARAVATTEPAQTACAIPLGFCGDPSVPGYGFSPGDWVNGKFGAGNGATGSFNWIDFTPPAGGAQELSDLLSGQGVCNLPDTGTSVGQTGVIQSLSTAWNSRFGLYKSGSGNPGPTSSPPDRSGFAYTPTSWPAQSNALSDFLSGRVPPSNKTYQGNLASGLSINGSFQSLTSAGLAQYGADRRLVTVPVVNCAQWATSQVIPVLDWACVLMLNPIDQPGDDVYMEFVGFSHESGSACASSGIGGGTIGPLVPVLVQ
jgi:hypothetical protein